MMMKRRPKIVFLGLLTKIPVAGAIWGTMHYLIGFRRLGFDVYYVEAHARTPSMFVDGDTSSATDWAVEFLADVMHRFDFDGRWAFHALHEGWRCYGMSFEELRDLYRSSELILNYHGGTLPRPGHKAAKRLVLLETDPVRFEIQLHKQRRDAIDFLAPHSTVFTWGLNYGNDDCQVPLPDEPTFHPTTPPVVMDLWQNRAAPGAAFTTIGNWRQEARDVRFKGERYTWSKHHEFLKFIDLPGRTSQQFELALSRYSDDDLRLLEDNGWAVHPALQISEDLDAYRSYIAQSRGEFTVAKDQNVRLRSGWFSERSAQYLAAGRPVITQDTGFGNALPTGKGLFAFTTMEDVLNAIDSVNADYERHSRAAAEIAREHFNYDVVLTDILDKIGLSARARSHA
jgi:hypothetical protein